MTAEKTALAVYGTMRPGEANHWVVRNITGTWTAGTLNGWVFELTWGAAEGYPGLVLDPDGQVVGVDILISTKLPAHWNDIDRFEGPGYRRVVTDVCCEDGQIIKASVYEAIQDGPDQP